MPIATDKIGGIRIALCRNDLCNHYVATAHEVQCGSGVMGCPVDVEVTRADGTIFAFASHRDE